MGWTGGAGVAKGGSCSIGKAAGCTGRTDTASYPLVIPGVTLATGKPISFIALVACAGRIVVGRPKATEG